MKVPICEINKTIYFSCTSLIAIKTRLCQIYFSFNLFLAFFCTRRFIRRYYNTIIHNVKVLFHKLRRLYKLKYCSLLNFERRFLHLRLLRKDYSKPINLICDEKKNCLDIDLKFQGCGSQLLFFVLLAAFSNFIKRFSILNKKVFLRTLQI